MATAEETLLIGLCDSAIGQNVASFSTNKIGGLPDCLPSISVRYPSCALCSTFLSHVVQVYCPLAASPYHRNINVFACPNPQCSAKSESWTALRSQCLDTTVCEDQKTKCATNTDAPMATRDWCDDADDWGEAEEEEPKNVGPAYSDNTPQSSGADVDFRSRMEGLCLVEEGESRPNVCILDIPGPVPTFCPYYISVLEEGDLLDQSDMEHAQRLLQEYEQREGVAVEKMGCCDSEGQVEKYEKTEARHGDQIFARFMKKISLCPEQILRYCWSGSPLLITDPPSNMTQMVPPCSRCGDPRIFEFQLMPALVSLLRTADSSSDMAVEFGTVLVYTSCQSARSRAETGAFSREEGRHYRNPYKQHENSSFTRRRRQQDIAPASTLLALSLLHPTQSPLFPYDWLRPVRRAL
ncbi:hypothetical protein AGOR_G00002250 [Albula goreensis]|uniref:Programmed cell death protein 2 C-terminal domain-containing protein n=1 Tax=Albula goreensis TaxID=1534307 RepID=A0A8T3E7D8_9TELE|nr:hypothetical protein AGOR_G00002250 [Albula goreensis]